VEPWKARQGYAEIAPVADDSARPFWSVMIPVYNCAEYLGFALRSVLAQLPPGHHTQIEVVDDCSTQDDPEAVVTEDGLGQVAYFRQPRNVGPQANFTTCIQRARGHWVHILHGDDMVAPDFYRTFESVARQHATVGAAFCQTINIDARNARIDLSPLEREVAGIHTNLIERLAVENLIMFPSIAVKRQTYERVGGFHPQLFHSADWDMWKRIALATDVWYEPRPLAMYRLHTDSDTSTLMRTGANIADARHAIAIAREYLPKERTAQLSSQALEYHALYALEIAQKMVARRSWGAARAQVREAFRCSQSRRVVAGALALACQAATQLAGRDRQESTTADVRQTPGNSGQVRV
jgi:glycosyltransferase involved in cell wall biosynthesis